ncbi:hypothetical protein [Pacificibacter marinus]|uniref:Uncharacterized protein n=1 Tax=Pacificibacter marinus TaxID=658057 RepID=A0A1Y5TSG4_9RHOB|nr:hypothetical protein [Pacificibacter marinus]SLN70370.1 hypothetical protein PAM7971_03769 [Pacificibacter marinus]
MSKTMNRGQGGEMLMERTLKTQTGNAVIVVGSDGTARLRAETDRVAKIKAAGAAPAQCGPEVPNAPARGAVRISNPRELVPGTTDKYQHAGWQKRSVMHRCDVFDTMRAQALNAHAKVKAKNKEAVFEEPFNAGQVSMARHYAGLHEGLQSGDLRGTSYGERVSGGGGGVDAVVLRLAARQEFEALERKVGRGVAMPMRKVRPSKRGAGRVCKMISDLDAVRAVCLLGLSMSEVLRKYDWTVSSRNSAALRAALRDALDRMQGYGASTTASK